MRRRGGADWRLGLAAAAFALLLGPVHSALALEAAEERGKQIYLKGTHPDGEPIMAIVGTEAVELPASAVPCASCHGADGRGREEGGILPSDVCWSQLTKSYGHVHETGRRHPAYDEESFAETLRSGVDPGGNTLDRSMPRYRLSDEAMADLVAYLRQLESDRDPGVSPDRVQVGTLLPLRGPRGPMGEAMARVMHAYLQEVNAEGGVYGRRLDLLTVAYGDSAESTLDNLRQAFREEGIFALVGAYTVGLDEDLLALLRERDVPLVGPFTLDPGNQLLNEGAFYLYPGFDEQARALADQALTAEGAGEAPAVIAGAQDPRVDHVVEAVVDQLGRGQATAKPVTVRYAPGSFDPAAVAERVQETGAESLFFFGGQAELQPLLEALAERDREPRVYLLSAFLSGSVFEAPEAFHQRLFIAYPTLASDFTAQGRADYQELAEGHGLPGDHMQAQAAALAAAKLLVEGLRRAGRDLDREGLIDGLEALYAYRTGLTPPLTYGPNRRIGARGAHIVTVDLMKKVYAPSGGWREVR